MFLFSLLFYCILVTVVVSVLIVHATLIFPLILVAKRHGGESEKSSRISIGFGVKPR